MTDELNAQVGVAREYLKSVPGAEQLNKEMEEIQSRLLDVGSAIATPLDSTKSNAKLQRVSFAMDHTVRLERFIDSMDEELPPLSNFILPGGGLAAAHLHVARTFARRAERRIVPLAQSGAVDSSVAIFMNRLSDFFFVAARFTAMKSSEPETVYKKAKVPAESSGSA